MQYRDVVDLQHGMIFCFLSIYRVWLVSALTSSRVLTSKCIMGFQATDCHADRQHFHVLFMKNGRVFWSVNYNNVYGRSITTNILGKWTTTANSTTLDSRSGWKSSPREIYQRNSGRVRTAAWNPTRTAAKNATTRNHEAARTSLSPIKVTPSPGDRGTAEQETWKSAAKPSAGDRGTEEYSSYTGDSNSLQPLHSLLLMGHPP